MKFNVNQVYSTRSICEWNCIFSYLIVKRTDKNVWIQKISPYGKPEKEVTRRKIDLFNGIETIFPDGSYSMCPVLGADDKNLLKTPEQVATENKISDIVATINEYQSIASEIFQTFRRDNCVARIESLRSEYGIEFLEKRLEKLRKQVQLQAV